MSRISGANRFAPGQVWYLPDKEFRWRPCSTHLVERSILLAMIDPACRDAVGTISSSAVAEVRRMVSEDSDHFIKWFLAIHGRHDLDDLDQPLAGAMSIALHQLDALCELLKIAPLCCSKRMLPKERDDHRSQIRSSTNAVAVQVLLMVVVA